MTISTDITTEQLPILLDWQMQNPLAPLMLTRGSPGGGKTSIKKQRAYHARRDLIYLDLSQKDALDTLGLPREQDGYTRFAMPLWMQRLDKPCVVLFDEIARAQPIVMSSILEFITERKVDALNFKVPDHVVMLAACNRKSDKADSRDLPSHFKGRASIYDLTNSVDAWAAHQMQNNGDPLVTGFFRKRPALLNSFDATLDINCTPRSASYLSGKMSLVRANPNIALQIIRSHIGEGPAIEFHAFMRLAHALVDADLILSDPHNAPVPDEPSALYATLSSLAMSVTRKRADNFFIYLGRVPRDIAATTVADASSRDDKIMESREGQRFVAQTFALLRAARA